MSTDRVARVRLYTTAAKRDADATRPAAGTPTGDHGLLLDVLTTTSMLTLDLSPTMDGWDAKVTPDGVIPITVDNLSGSTGTVTATLTYLQTE